jgi:hypothetical protein
MPPSSSGRHHDRPKAVLNKCIFMDPAMMDAASVT